MGRHRSALAKSLQTAMKPLSTPDPTNADRPAWVSRTQVCPRCQGYVIRVPRRLVDRVMSLLLPRQRYSCQSAGCHWEGNLRPGADRKHATRRGT